MNTLGSHKGALFNNIYKAELLHDEGRYEKVSFHIDADSDILYSQLKTLLGCVYLHLFNTWSVVGPSSGDHFSLIDETERD